MRNKALALTTEEFVSGTNDYADQDIWDIKYISTSDEEDNDSDIASSNEDDDSEEKSSNEEDKSNSSDDEVTKNKKEKDSQFIGGDRLPHLFRKFKNSGKGAKGPPRV